MERLTRVIKGHGNDVIVYTQGKYTDTTAGEMKCKDVRNVMKHLCAYENTGLTPPEIMELKERDTEKSVCHYHEEEKFRAYCPTCKRYLGIDFKEGYRGPKNTFCPGCGQRVQWED